jgi:intracellular sulfur oxidation DsrE/DsrF family protein
MSLFPAITHRRGFLGSLAGSAAAVGLGSLVPQGLMAAPDATPAIPGAGDAAFLAWLDGIKGKYKQLYDATETNGGLPLIWPLVFLMTAAPSYGVPESDISVVVVLRHSGIPIALKDDLWAKYKFGELYKVDDPATKAPSVRNIYTNLKPGDMPFPDAALEKLQARGVRFGVCAMAIKFYSGMVAKQMNMDAAVVEKEWLAGVLPGVQVVPSGVLAVNGAQSRGCAYCFAG